MNQIRVLCLLIIVSLFASTAIASNYYNHPKKDHYDYDYSYEYEYEETYEYGYDYEYEYEPDYSSYTKCHYSPHGNYDYYEDGYYYYNNYKCYVYVAPKKEYPKYPNYYH